MQDNGKIFWPSNDTLTLFSFGNPVWSYSEIQNSTVASVAYFRRNVRTFCYNTQKTCLGYQEAITRIGFHQITCFFAYDRHLHLHSDCRYLCPQHWFSRWTQGKINMWLFIKCNILLLLKSKKNIRRMVLVAFRAISW